MILNGSRQRIKDQSLAERINTLVIGAGIVGLATAKALAEQGRDVILLEKNPHFGEETSSRNSEVIHAGIYYRPGGIRARLCHPGKELLYAYARDRGVAHLNCGKLVVAHDEAGIGKLNAIIENAKASGVHDLELIDRRKVAELEPGLVAHAAIISPSSGIIDSHGLMLAILGDFENAGGIMALSTPVESGRVTEAGIEVDCGGEAPMTLLADLVVNCGGLHADKVAHSITGLDRGKIPPQRPAKGEYFTYAGKAPFQRLIYPIHTADSQGVHYSRDLGGQARLGPDISWEAKLGDYSVNEEKREVFAAECQKFWPDLDPSRLSPGYAGQRPKTTNPGEEGDFRICGPEEHGTKGYIGLYGIESPGLTSCLAIARFAAELAAKAT